MTKRTNEEWKASESWLPKYLRDYESQLAFTKVVNKQGIFKHKVTRKELIDFMWFWAERKHVLYRSSRDGYYIDLKEEMAQESMPTVSEMLEAKTENMRRRTD